jgi:hypothetical protein
MKLQGCSHIASLSELKAPESHVCDECVEIGSRWVHLRTCQTCGATLCCDSSPHRHMTKHNQSTGHPVVISAEPGEQWIYCYQDDLMVGY